MHEWKCDRCRAVIRGEDPFGFDGDVNEHIDMHDNEEEGGSA